MGGFRTGRRLALSTLGVVLLLGMNATDAGAAIGLIQNLGNAGDDTASSTSLSVTLASDAAVGNTVIVSFAMDPAASTVTCSESVPIVSWKSAATTRTISTTSRSRLAVWNPDSSTETV